MIKFVGNYNNMYKLFLLILSISCDATEGKCKDSLKLFLKLLSNFLLFYFFTSFVSYCCLKLNNCCDHRAISECLSG